MIPELSISFLSSAFEEDDSIPIIGVIGGDNVGVPGREHPSSYSVWDIGPSPLANNPTDPVGSGE